MPDSTPRPLCGTIFAAMCGEMRNHPTISAPCLRPSRRPWRGCWPRLAHLVFGLLLALASGCIVDPVPTPGETSASKVDPGWRTDGAKDTGAGAGAWDAGSNGTGSLADDTQAPPGHADGIGGSGTECPDAGALAAEVTPVTRTPRTPDAGGDCGAWRMGKADAGHNDGGPADSEGQDGTAPD